MTSVAPEGQCRVVVGCGFAKLRAWDSGCQPGQDTGAAFGDGSPGAGGWGVGGGAGAARGGGGEQQRKHIVGAREISAEWVLGTPRRLLLTVHKFPEPGRPRARASPGGDTAVGGALTRCPSLEMRNPSLQGLPHDDTRERAPQDGRSSSQGPARPRQPPGRAGATAVSGAAPARLSPYPAVLAGSRGRGPRKTGDGEDPEAILEVPLEPLGPCPGRPAPHLMPGPFLRSALRGSTQSSVRVSSGIPQGVGCPHAERAPSTGTGFVCLPSFFRANEAPIHARSHPSLSPPCTHPPSLHPPPTTHHPSTIHPSSITHHPFIHPSTHPPAIHTSTHHPPPMYHPPSTIRPPTYAPIHPPPTIPFSRQVSCARSGPHIPPSSRPDS